MQGLYTPLHFCSIEQSSVLWGKGEEKPTEALREAQPEEQLATWTQAEA